SVTRRSQDWTGHRLGGMKPGGPVGPQAKEYASAALATTGTEGGYRGAPVSVRWALTLGAPFHPLAVLLSCIAAGGCSLPLDDPRPSSVVTSGDSLALGASVAPGRGDLSRLLATALLWPGLRLLILRYPGFVITNDALHGTNSEDRALLATDGNRDGAECHGEPRKLDGRAALILR